MRAPVVFKLAFTLAFQLALTFTFAAACTPDFAPIEPPERVLINPTFSTCLYRINDAPIACIPLSQPRDPCPEYRGERGVWYELAERGAPEGQLALPAGRFVLVLDNGADASLYDICSSEWQRVSDENSPDFIYFPATVGSTFINYGDPSIASKLDIATGQWSPISVENMPLTSGLAFGLARHLVVVEGTIDDGAAVNFERASVYDVDADEWRVSSSTLSNNRQQAALAAVGERIFVWGGIAAGDEGFLEQRGDGFVFDPATGEYDDVPLDGAPSARLSPLAAAVGDDVIVWGGYDEFTSFGHVDGAVFNVVTRTWRALPRENAPTPRRLARMQPYTRGVVVHGGYNPTNGDFATTSARFDMDTFTWRTVGEDDSPFGISFIVPRSYATEDGDVVVVDASGGTGAWMLDDDAWRPLELGPLGRFNPSLVWTGARLISWSGFDANLNVRFSGAQIVP